MVSHRSNWVNRVKQPLLLVGIIAIGIFDLAFMSYLTGGNVSNPGISQVETNVSYVESPAREIKSVPHVVENNLPEKPASGNDFKVASNGDSRLRFTNYATAHSLKSKQPNRNLQASRSLPFQNRDTAFGCRTVDYPFVGDNYYVQVTDDVGCLPSSAARAKYDSLMARSYPGGNKRVRTFSDVSNRTRKPLTAY